MRAMVRSACASTLGQRCCFSKRMLSVSHFAGRVPVGTPIPVTVSKKGPFHIRQEENDTEEMMVVGAACSECFSGPRLAEILQPGFDYEREALMNLNKGNHAAPLSIHTSAGVPQALPEFIRTLESALPSHLAAASEEWFASLQVEGTSAVREENTTPHEKQKDIFSSLRTKVAVSEFSYHGPGSSSFGSASPLGAKPMQRTYPMPAYHKRRIEAGESLDEFHQRMRQEYVDFLNREADELGVILFEPQSGSSLAAQPWDKEMLKEYVRLAKERGIKVLADEVMCGLARHGEGDLFLSKSWDLRPDAVTFGKAVAGGVFPLAGCLVFEGGGRLREEGRTVLQSHTYAGSNIRALITAREVGNVVHMMVLKKTKEYGSHIQKMSKGLESAMQEAEAASNGNLVSHGMGLMWGLAWSRGSCALDRKMRKKANAALKNACKAHRIWPYFVDMGVMVTPTYDIQEEEVICPRCCELFLGCVLSLKGSTLMATNKYPVTNIQSELGRRLSAAVGEAMSNLGWKKSGQH
eukprot:jgi/Bigna1/66534/fgenesh1_pg.1_\